MKDYTSSHAIVYEQPKQVGFCSLPVLHFLWGKPWNQMALNFVHSLNPSCIRVVWNELKIDAWGGRVTVYVTSGIIIRIEQEVEVGLDEDYQHGHDLCCQAEKAGIRVRCE